jgi:uncharacterized Zn finger protein (UPF0148 family)
MTDLITEARELCKYSEKIVNQLHTERLDYELEYMPLIETIQVTSELCDALEKAEERGQGCEHCQGWDTRSGAQYCPMCGKKLPVYAGTIGGEMVRHALKELGAEERKVQSMNEIERLKSIDVNGAIAQALRKQAEREKGCEYCLQGEDLAYGHDSMQRTGRIYLDGKLLTADLYSESMAVAVCYCPMCGKRLEEHHEAD